MQIFLKGACIIFCLGIKIKDSLAKHCLAVWQKTVHSLKQKNWIAFFSLALIHFFLRISMYLKSQCNREVEYILLSDKSMNIHHYLYF